MKRFSRNLRSARAKKKAWQPSFFFFELPKAALRKNFRKTKTKWNLGEEGCRRRSRTTQSFNIERRAAPFKIQYAGVLSVSISIVMMKLVLCPVVDSVPARTEVL